MSNFAFLPDKYQTIANSAIKAEGHIQNDPRAACFHARFALDAEIQALREQLAEIRARTEEQPGLRDF